MRDREYKSGYEAAERHHEEAMERMTDGYNIMRDALSWFDAHSVADRLGHLPQWVPMARELLARPR